MIYQVEQSNLTQGKRWWVLKKQAQTETTTLITVIADQPMLVGDQVIEKVKNQRFSYHYEVVAVEEKTATGNYKGTPPNLYTMICHKKRVDPPKIIIK